MPREVIVPGVRDLIPPQGLVTVQLTHPDTGKVVHEVKAENMIANCWLAQVNGHFRGAMDNDNSRNQYLPNFSPVAANSDAGFTREYVWAHLGRPGIYPGMYGAYMPWLWASDKNIAPNASRTVPPCSNLSLSAIAHNLGGNMTGHVRTDVAHATTTGQVNRGTTTAAESWHKWDQSRLTVEFATSEGNGTYRSIGVGRLASAYQANRCIVQPLSCADVVSLRATGSQNVSYGQGVINIGSNFVRSASFEDSNHFWLSSTANALFVYDFETNTTTNGPTSASIPGTNQISVVVKGSDLWLARDKQIFRCVKFTGSTLSITNTYNLATPLGAENILDMTQDGTSIYLLTQTKVFVVNPADGTVTTSWAHNLTHFDAANCCSIEWDGANQHLWIHFGVDNDPQYQNDSSQWIWNWQNGWGTYGYTTQDINTKVFSFSTAGVLLPYIILLHAFAYQIRSYAFTGMDPQGWFAMWANFGDSGYRQGFMNMCSMIGSHALLGSDVVKTSTNGLKIVYDFNFA